MRRSPSTGNWSSRAESLTSATEAGKDTFEEVLVWPVLMVLCGKPTSREWWVGSLFSGVMGITLECGMNA